MEHALPALERVAESVHASPAWETVIERVDAPRSDFSLLDEMFVSRGTKDDWEKLHELHYKAEGLPIGPRFWRLDLQGETIGVLVTGCPRGMLKERHIAFPKLKPGSGESKATNTWRYQFINAHFRVISRFVIDTMYRGIGAGYRMMNLVARLEGNAFMEIQSSMSKFNFFGQKAGFRFVRPMNATKYEPTMRFFRSHFAATPQDFEAILSEAATRSPAEQARLLEACLDFYFKNSALENTSNGGEAKERRREAMNLRAAIRAIQQMGLASPLYGVWKNPDPKTLVLPERLPLRAFDWQQPTESFHAR